MNCMSEPGRVPEPIFAAETASFFVEKENSASDIGYSPLNSWLSSLNPSASESPGGRIGLSGAMYMLVYTPKLPISQQNRKMRTLTKPMSAAFSRKH